MRVIIIPTDFSENAFNALTCALQYFDNEEATFIIVHTYEEKEQHQLKEFDDQLDHLLERVEYLTDNPLHNFETKNICGNFITQLNDLVDIQNADLVVMGTQGRTADRKLSFGSNTLQVIKKVKCPVLAIPLELEFKSPDHILLPSELLIPFKNRELDLISSMALHHGSELRLLHMAKFDSLSKRQLQIKALVESRFRESEITYLHHDLGVPTTVINNLISQNHIDLLILVNSKHSFLESFLQLPTIDSLSLNLKIPFLILQNLSR
ncbi:universal stress protein [uncultured Nonlabens sp.]|uniref:universal stress protein n=1 Tax=uncultured Nonlabens sp. TaxID=859306 RepID=UPI0030D720B0|tara:strand:+ start:31604 stop:32401 length:798 start_codon:yes stop_codon:yes gene_type:complete